MSNLVSSAVSDPRNFHPFAKVPLEVRLDIWEEALTTWHVAIMDKSKACMYRAVPDDPNTVARSCHEASEAMKKLFPIVHLEWHFQTGMWKSDEDPGFYTHSFSGHINLPRLVLYYPIEDHKDYYRHSHPLGGQAEHMLYHAVPRAGYLCRFIHTVLDVNYAFPALRTLTIILPSEEQVSQQFHSEEELDFSVVNFQTIFSTIEKNPNPESAEIGWGLLLGLAHRDNARAGPALRVYMFGWDDIVSKDIREPQTLKKDSDLVDWLSE